MINRQTHVSLHFRLTDLEDIFGRCPLDILQLLHQHKFQRDRMGSPLVYKHGLDDGLYIFFRDSMAL